MLELVIGGARSGKSTYAERCAQQYINQFDSQPGDTESRIIFVATATAADAEMSARIEHHRQSRPASWQTVEEPVKLATVLKLHDNPSRFIIVDCLTLWLTNLLMAGDEQKGHELESLLTILPRLTSSVIFVSNEVGMGIVPLGEQSRRFVDEAGWLHQRLAAQCHRVTQMVAGIPNRIKDEH
jgi:adenosylcobinamide kinase/adenosylcobinamide-phosphate guanylyltransferase